jgi:hypothetical protein
MGRREFRSGLLWQQAEVEKRWGPVLSQAGGWAILLSAHGSELA